MKVERLDPLVLTVADVEASCAFYARVLGMEVVSFGQGRKALAFGQQKINLHRHGHEFEPKARRPTPGSGDLCLLIDTPIEQAQAQLQALGVVIEQGPVARTGATGPITSLYFRDPDDNLIEISRPA